MDVSEVTKWSAGSRGRAEVRLLRGVCHTWQFPRTRSAKQDSDHDRNKRPRVDYRRYSSDDFRTHGGGYHRGAVRIQRYHDADAFSRGNCLSYIHPTNRFSSTNRATRRSTRSSRSQSDGLLRVLEAGSPTFKERVASTASESGSSRVAADTLVFLSGNLEDVSMDGFCELQHFLTSFFGGDSFAVVGVRPVVPPEIV